MRIGSTIGAIVLLALPIPTRAAAQALPREQGPAKEVGRWEQQPTVQDFERLGPPAAVRDGISGRVTLDCELSAQGRPRDCQVKAETPAGQGFAAAALKLGPLYKLRQTLDVELEGSRLTFIIKFNYAPRTSIVATAPPPPSPPPPPPQSAQAPSAVASPAIVAQPVSPPPAIPARASTTAGRMFQAAIVPGWQADFVDLDRIAVNGSMVEVYRLSVAAPGRDSSGGVYELSQLSVDCTTGAQALIASEVHGASGGVIARGVPAAARVPTPGTPEATISSLVCDTARPTRVDAVGLAEALAFARKSLGGP